MRALGALVLQVVFVVQVLCRPYRFRGNEWETSSFLRSSVGMQTLPLLRQRRRRGIPAGRPRQPTSTALTLSRRSGTVGITTGDRGNEWEKTSLTLSRRSGTVGITTEDRGNERVCPSDPIPPPRPWGFRDPRCHCRLPSRGLPGRHSRLRPIRWSRPQTPGGR